MRREGLVIGLVGLLSTAITWQPAWSADRYVLVTGFLSGNIVRFDLSTGAAEQVIALHPSSGGDTGDRPRGMVVGGGQPDLRCIAGRNEERPAIYMERRVCG